MWMVDRQHKQNDTGETVAIELHDADGFMRANVRWDGGMQVWIRSRTEENVEINDTFHTSDINGLIDKLEDLRKVSQEYFDFKGYWKPDDDPEDVDI